MNRFVWLCAASAGPILLFTVETVTAESNDDERARAHFEAGASHYEAGDYSEALNEFQRAHEIPQRPELFYNISLAYQQLGNLDQAIVHLEHYLAEESDVPNRSNLERRLANLRERLDAQRTAPAVTETASAPANPGGPGGRVTGQTGQTAGDVGSDVPAAAWIGWGIGAAGLIGGAVFGGLALAEKGDISEMSCAENDTCSDSVVESMERNALISDILLLGVGLGGAAIGTLLFFVLREDSSEKGHAHWTLSPWVADTQGGAAVRGVF